MNIQQRLLLTQDINQAYELDKKWFGENGISKEELNHLVIQNPGNTLVLAHEDELLGFAAFEILEKQVPKQYVGHIENQGKILFIQQFTTSTNYASANSGNDHTLLSAVENKAKAINCTEVWEALAVDHPYKKENNILFDAFGFYEAEGYFPDKTHLLTWQPNKNVSIPCYLFRKNLS